MCSKDPSSPFSRISEGVQWQDKVLHYLRHSHNSSEEFAENLRLPEATEHLAVPVTNFRCVEKEQRNGRVAVRAGERKALTFGPGDSAECLEIARKKKDDYIAVNVI